MLPEMLVIVGPTASGKTRLAVELAMHYNGEVVSADSMQIYRHMDIGTAKPTAEEMRSIPHHMLDIVEPQEDFSVARYVETAVPIIDDIRARGKLPILAGGTGLYIDSLLSGRTFAPFAHDDGLRSSLTARYQEVGGDTLLAELREIDPDAAARLAPNDAKRIIRALEIYHYTGKTQTEHDLQTQAIPPRYHAATIGLRFQERSVMWQYIDRRVDKMVEDGLVAEVENLLARGVPPDCTAMQAIGYKQLIPALRGDGSISDAMEEIKLRSRQYAKRQLTWFRRNPNIHWIEWNNIPDFAIALLSSTKYMENFR